jgi:hypothetical protein
MGGFVSGSEEGPDGTLPGVGMDTNALILFAVMAVLVAACIIMFLSFYNSMRRAGSESRRRLIARAAVVTWLALAVLTPAILLSALGIVPTWVCGVGVVVASLISVLAARYARRSTLRSQSLS